MDIEIVYREERARALATLIRLLGDFDLAEDALQDAFAAALLQWPREGVPQSPRAWLVSAGKAPKRFRTSSTPSSRGCSPSHTGTEPHC